MNDSAELHTIHSFDEDLRSLHCSVAEIGALAVDQLCLALEALKKRDLALARRVAEQARAVDAMALAADDAVCAVLAKRCPKAGDLRVVMAASKIVGDLGRIGAEALKLANFVAYLHGFDGREAACFPLDDIDRLGAAAVKAAQAALDAYERLDGAAARAAGELQLTLHREFQAGLHRLMDFLRAESADTGFAVSQSLMLKALDRVGDHASSIAGHVVYQVDGQAAGHGAPDLARDFPLPGQA